MLTMLAAAKRTYTPTAGRAFISPCFEEDWVSIVDVGEQPYAWLTTTGRRSGVPRTVELWFVLDGRTLYFLAGGGERAQWVRNADADPRVSVRIGSSDYQGLSRRPISGSEEDRVTRRRLASKYQGWQEGRPLSSWAARSLCVAVDLCA